MRYEISAEFDFNWYNKYLLNYGACDSVGCDYAIAMHTISAMLSRRD